MPTGAEGDYDLVGNDNVGTGREVHHRRCRLVRRAAIPKLTALTLPEAAFPMFAWSLVGDYEMVRQAITDITNALTGAMAAIGGALSAVAADYEKQEKIRTDNFSYPG
jgi:hypothetical protein